MNGQTQKGYKVPAIISLLLIIGRELLAGRVSGNSLPIGIDFGLILLMLLCIGILYMIFSVWTFATIRKINDTEDNSMYADSDEHGDNLPLSFQCMLYPRRYCSADDLIDSDFYRSALDSIEMSASELSTYNLITDTDFNILESEFFEKHPNGEIWVISVALETEIELEKDIRDKKQQSDQSLRQSMKLVADNIAKGAKYVQFVALKDKGRNPSYLARREQYWAAKPELKTDKERQDAMPIIRIDSEDFKSSLQLPAGTQDWTYMIQLTSTVFLRDVTTGSTMCDGYFCLRPETKLGKRPKDYRTILYKMPSECMAEKMAAVLEQAYRGKL